MKDLRRLLVGALLALVFHLFGEVSGELNLFEVNEIDVDYFEANPAERGYLAKFLHDRLAPISELDYQEVPDYEVAASEFLVEEHQSHFQTEAFSTEEVTTADLTFANATFLNILRFDKTNCSDLISVNYYQLDKCIRVFYVDADLAPDSSIHSFMFSWDYNSSSLWYLYFNDSFCMDLVNTSVKFNFSSGGEGQCIPEQQLIYEISHSMYIPETDGYVYL
jgi:hypothetical protein